MSSSGASVSASSAHDSSKFLAAVAKALSLEQQPVDVQSGQRVRGARHVQNVNAHHVLFHLLSKLYEHTSAMITTNLDFAEWSSVFGDAKMAPTSLVR